MSVFSIPIAQLVIFAIFCQPALYILWKHGKHGILGWICLQSFCLVRIVGSILQIIQQKNNSMSPLAILILNSYGLSPLLLACLWILHEARQARNLKLNNTLEWVLIIQYHTIITPAVGLVIIGIVRLQNGTDLLPSNSIFITTGLTMVILCWLLLLTWALVSLPKQYQDAATYAAGTKLLYGALLAMPFIGLRIIYGVCYFFITNPDFKNSVPAKVVLSVVPEMIVAAILIVVGMTTVNMWRIKRKDSEYRITFIDMLAL